jgi:hypothetical protein
MGTGAAAKAGESTAIVHKTRGDSGTPASLLECCEATFNIEIGAEEASAARTVGELYNIIRWKCQDDRVTGSPCAVADSYRGLRDHLMERGLIAAARPTAALEVIFGPNPRAEWALLRARFGKAVPGLTLSEGETCAMSMIVALGLSAAVFGGLYVNDVSGNSGLAVLTALGAVALSFGIVFVYGALFAQTIPYGLKTLADLARLTAGELKPWAAMPARKPVQMWEALSDIVRRETGTSEPVTRESAVASMAKPERRAS